jgi:hypothetical protein
MVLNKIKSARSDFKTLKKSLSANSKGTTMQIAITQIFFETQQCIEFPHFFSKKREEQTFP